MTVRKLIQIRCFLRKMDRDVAVVNLLCGRVIGRITRIAHPSVRLSVRPSICPVRARNSKRKKHRKIKIGVHVPHGSSKWSANFFVPTVINQGLMT